MKKQLQLIRVMLKCGRIGKMESGNSAVGDTNTLITLIIAAIVVVVMFLGGQYAAGHAAVLGNGQTVFTTLMVATGLLAFMLTFMTAVNQLYLSSDLDVLVTMPFTPFQIVTAKLVSVGMLPAALCFGMIVPASVGYFMSSSGLSALFIPIMIIGALLLTVYVVSMVAVLLMIIMRVFRFIRSRNVISVVSALLVFALSIAYVVFTTGDDQLGEEQVTGIFNAMGGIASGVAVAFPGIGATIAAAYGDLPQLLLALLATLGMVVILMLCARFLYFQAALGMTDANGNRSPIKDAAMKKYTAKAGVSRTLFRREVSQILRTPSLITNGYLFSFVMPFVVLVPILVSIGNGIRQQLTEAGAELSLSALRELFTSAALPASMLLVFASAVAMLMVVLAVSVSSLSRYLISREGKDFASLKAMPVSARTLVVVKSRAAMLFNGVSGLIVPALLLLAAGVLGFLPLWVSLISIVVNAAWLVVFVDVCAVVDVKKPNLNWESESDVVKNNIPGLILLGITFVLAIGAIFLCLKVAAQSEVWLAVMAAAFVVVPVVLAVVTDRQLRTAADHLYD